MFCNKISRTKSDKDEGCFERFVYLFIVDCDYITGADIKVLAASAALHAAKENRNVVLFCYADNVLSNNMMF